MSKAQQQIERLSEKIPLGGCWIWTGALNGTQYGQLTFQGKHTTAHRASFEAFVRTLLDGELVLHRCDVRQCVNPHHLYAGSYRDNRRDMLERSGWRHPYGKRTHCFAGHEYVEGSFRLDSRNGSRVCKICAREFKYKQRKAAKLTRA